MTNRQRLESMMTIKLSRRNLLHLLSKLERGDDSASIIKRDGNCIIAEQDEIHYRGKTVGYHTPITQKNVDEIEDFLALRRRMVNR